MALENKFESLFDSMCELSFEIGRQFYAKPTHVIDPQDFYLMPYPFLIHLPALNKAGRRFELDELKVNATVIFKSHKRNLNKYLKPFIKNKIRGTIQKIGSDQNCVIYAPDHGFFEENVPIDRLYHPAHQESSEIPPLVHHCELDLCAPKGPNFDHNAITAFKYYIRNEKLSVVVQGKNVDKLRVTVYNSNPDDISTLLALTHYTYLTHYVREQNAVTVRRQPAYTFDHLDISSGDTIEVRVQSGTHLDSFYVTPLNTYKTYLESRAQFTEYCRLEPELKEVDFHRGSSVGVKDETNGLYERAMILRVNERKTEALVKFVDWGSEIVVPKHMIKLIRSKLYMAAPASALYCRVVEGFQPWDNGLPQFLYKGYTFHVTVKQIGYGFRSPHIVLLTQTD